MPIGSILSRRYVGRASGTPGSRGIQGPIGATGPTLLDNMEDVSITGLTGGQILTYNTSTNKWENVSLVYTSFNFNDLPEEDINYPYNLPYQQSATDKFVHINHEEIPS